MSRAPRSTPRLFSGSLPAARNPAPAARTALAALTAATLLITSCTDDDDGTASPTTTEAEAEAGVAADEPEDVIEPVGGVGDTVTYRGATDSGDEWELAVTVQGLECGIELDDIAVQSAEDRFCAVQLFLENSAEVGNAANFVQSTLLQTADGTFHPAQELATSDYADQRGDEGPSAVEPGESTERSLVFSIPASEEPRFLHLQATPLDPIVVVDVSGA